MLGNLLSVSAYHGLGWCQCLKVWCTIEHLFCRQYAVPSAFLCHNGSALCCLCGWFCELLCTRGVFLKLKVHWSLFLGFGKPENFWKLYRCQGNVGISVKIWELSGNNLIRENCPNTSLLNVAHLCFSCIIYICVISELLLGLGYPSWVTVKIVRSAANHQGNVGQFYFVWRLVILYF